MRISKHLRSRTKPKTKGAFGKKRLTEVKFTYTDKKTGEKSSRKMIIG